MKTLLKAMQALPALSVLSTLLCVATTEAATTLYVSLVSTNPTPPYADWATAATNIQDAVDVALAGDEILVTDGVYQTGARPGYWMSNRVAVTQPVALRSVNGPMVTHIVGSGPNGPAAVRCVYLTNGAVLAGFTLTNGATQISGDTNVSNQSGGGVACDGLNAVVSNCVLTGNSAGFGGGSLGGTLHNCTLTGNTAGHFGGGSAFGTLNNCTLSGNSAGDDGGGSAFGTLNNCTLAENSGWFGGGAYYGTLNHCMITRNSGGFGGGAFRSTLNDCIITANSAPWGGGARESILNNCVLTGNYAYNGEGGGAYNSSLNNCTLTGNSCDGAGCGAYSGTLNNCIIYYNGGRFGSGGNYAGGTLNDCCTAPLPAGPGNLTNAPLFLDTNGWSDLRLQTNSPCINAGNNPYALGPTDLDGNPRIAGGTVDMGAYEFQGSGLSGFPAWLWQYGLPTDGSADATDPDQDSLNNWQEWQADTDPTNALSVLRITTISASLPVMVQFLTSSNRLYTLLYATNLSAAPWTNVPGQTDVPGTGGGQTLSDTNAAPPRFYRVRARLP